MSARKTRESRSGIFPKDHDEERTPLDLPPPPLEVSRGFQSVKGSVSADQVTDKEVRAS
jgi:hypothetical protein